MQTITKWVLSYTRSNELCIEEKHLSPYVPLNRYLDNAGYYNLTAVNVDGTHYIVASEQKETQGFMSHILVTKTDGRGPISMQEDDKSRMEHVAKTFLKQNTSLLT